MTFEKAIAKLLLEYVWAKEQKHIYNPVAYSLYQVWKQANKQTTKIDFDYEAED